MRLVPVDKLKTDATIALDVMNAKNLLLIGAGSKVTPKTIDQLRRANLDFIYINDEYCTQSSSGGCVFTTDSQAMLNIINRLNEVIKQINMGLGNSRDIMRVQQLANEIVDEFFETNGNFKIAFEPVKMVVNSVVEQTIYITIMSVALGMKMGLARPSLTELCMVGLLRDFALMAPENSPILKGVTEDEIANDHMMYAYRFLRQYSQITKRVLDGIMHHHEECDGSGFPGGIKSEKISVFAKIISVIDYFYKLKSNSTSMVVEEGLLETAFKSALDKFDYEVVAVFIQNVELFNVDTLVKLNNGDIAVIIQNSAFTPFRPVIKILKSDTYEINKEIDLGDTGTDEFIDIKLASVIYYMEDAL